MNQTINNKCHVPKDIKVLLILTDCSLNKLEALTACDDACLNSTISRLATQRGILIDRKKEPHVNQAGDVTYFTRYSLPDSQRKLAQRLIFPYLVKVLLANQIKLEYVFRLEPDMIMVNGDMCQEVGTYLSDSLEAKAARLINPYRYKI